MKQFFVLFTAGLSLAVTAVAQDVDVDKKTGLVMVDAKEAFYLTPKNKTIMHSDYALENLQHEELAYLKYAEVPKYTRSGGTSNQTVYQMVFTKSGNQCTIEGFNLLSGVMKPLAKQIAGANLVKDGAVSLSEERKFIVLNHGTFLVDPYAASAPAENVRVVNNEPQKSAGPADISLKESNIYNNSELVGVFKRTEENDVTTITVYNSSDAMICKAAHPNKDGADWEIMADGKTATILYNPAAPLEKLFKYLVEKGYL